MLIMKLSGPLLIAIASFVGLAYCECPNKDEIYLLKTKNFRNVCDSLRSYLIEKKQSSGLTKAILDAAIEEARQWDTQTSIQAHFSVPGARVVIAMLQLQRELLFRGEIDQDLKKFERYYRLVKPLGGEFRPIVKGGEHESGLVDVKNLDNALRNDQPLVDSAILKAYLSHEKYLEKLETYQIALSAGCCENSTAHGKEIMEYKLSLLKYMFDFPILNRVIFPQYLASDLKMELEEMKRIYNQEMIRTGLRFVEDKLEFV